MSVYTSPDFPLTVEDNGNGSFTIEWDHEDPLTNALNEWTEEDFMRAISQGIDDELFILAEEAACAKN